jgi:3-deoxy-7-phosphoheptulonate synthase
MGSSTSTVVLLQQGITSEQHSAIAQLLTADSAAPAPRLLTLGPLTLLRSTSAVPTATLERLAAHPAVQRVATLDTPYTLASLAVHPRPTTVRVRDLTFGGSAEPVIIAGPCAVEGKPQILEAARAVREAGARMLRGGAFKPRTSPYSFQGLGLAGLEMLVAAGQATGLPIVSEVMEPGLVDAVAAHVDLLQVGSRNMQNFALLHAVGRSRKPVLLKRGFAATIEEWLLSAEYILTAGNPNVILCERGIRGFDPQTRNVLDLTCVPLLRTLTHLPVIVDPSHATGRADLVVPMAVAAIAAGADGLIVEVHPHPEEALSDSEQAITPDDLRRLITRSRAVHAALRNDATDDSTDDPTRDEPARDLLALGGVR